MFNVTTDKYELECVFGVYIYFKDKVTGDDVYLEAEEAEAIPWQKLEKSWKAIVDRDLTPLLAIVEGLTAVKAGAL